MVYHGYRLVLGQTQFLNRKTTGPLRPILIRFPEETQDLVEEPNVRLSSGFRNQLERAALSVSNNIAEGFERGVQGTARGGAEGTGISPSIPARSDIGTPLVSLRRGPSRPRRGGWGE